MRARVRTEYEGSTSQDASRRYEAARREYIHRMAVMFADRLFPDEPERSASVAEIEESYNGLCDDFFTAKAYIETEHIVEGINPGKNDNFDIAHLLYAGPNVLVTDDKKLRRLANLVRSGMAISVGELRSILRLQQEYISEGASAC
jgi:hypothetical protein